jgi:multiple antibiotic resistance protein
MSAPPNEADMTHLHAFLEVFIPLFVTIDAFGLIPVFVSVTRGMPEPMRRRVSFEAVGAALVISIAFMFLGKAIFQFLGITPADFKIAGGIILLVLAVLDILILGKPAVNEMEMVGLVPLAMPLIAGPATLTTTLVLADRYGYAMTSLSLAANCAILLAALVCSSYVARAVGLNALRAFSKLVMVLLAAIAVNFIRSGIVEVLADTYHK